jgi:hypothetical protein
VIVDDPVISCTYPHDRSAVADALCEKDDALIIFNVPAIPISCMRFPGIMIVVLILFFLLVLSGCVSPPYMAHPPGESSGTPVIPLTGGAMAAPGQEPAGLTDRDLQVSIDPDILIYTPTLSSVPGIGLTPNLTGPAYPGTLQYHWQTDYGHFISWNPPGLVIRELGTNVTLTREKVYWTYNETGPLTGRPPARIILMVEDTGSGMLQTAAVLEVEWDESGLNATVPG